MRRRLIKYGDAKKIGMEKEVDLKFRDSASVAYVCGKSPHKGDELAIGDRVGDESAMWEIIAD